MNRDDIKKIMSDVVANKARLDACVGIHRFEAFERFGESPGALCKYKCSKCGGTVDQHALHWYQSGLSHARALVGELIEELGG